MQDTEPEEYNQPHDLRRRKMNLGAKGTRRNRLAERLRLERELQHLQFELECDNASAEEETRRCSRSQRDLPSCC